MNYNTDALKATVDKFCSTSDARNAKISPSSFEVSENGITAKGITGIEMIYIMSRLNVLQPFLLDHVTVNKTLMDKVLKAAEAAKDSKSEIKTPSGSLPMLRELLCLYLESQYNVDDA